MKRFFILPLLVLSALTFGQLPEKESYSFDIKQIHSGHSLTDPLFNPWPGQYRFLMTDELSVPWDNLGKSTIPGSPLHWRWNHSGDVSPDARLDIGDWELLSITEGVPLFIDTTGLQSWQEEGLAEQRAYFSLFVNNAWENGDGGDGAPTLLWTTWTNIDDSDGPWRELLDIYEDEWENMQDYANDSLQVGGTPVYLIPGHRMMARLYDDIQADLVPDVDTIADLFDDNIHVNHLGAYAVAMIHYACIYNRNPTGLPNNLYADQNNSVHPSPELAAYLQEMIWEVVTGYSERTGVSDEVMTIAEPGDYDEMFFFPNPVGDELHVEMSGPIHVFNLQGRLILESSESIIDVSALQPGSYMISMEGKTARFEKL
jgi:hypothetical protein